MLKTKKIKQNAPVVPVLVWIGFLVGVPLIYVLALSFLSRDHLGNVVLEFTLDNYKRIVDPVYLKVFYAHFAGGINRADHPADRVSCCLLYRKFGIEKAILAIILIILPFWISSLLRTYGWIILLGNTGLINNMLLKLNIIQQPLNMMYHLELSLSVQPIC